MPTEPYAKNPALRPTVLAHDVLENVYRPTPAREAPQPRSDATTTRSARETPRAA